MYNFFVATNGCDQAEGTADKPFKTIERAQEVVRELLQNRPEVPVTVMVREGEYRTAGLVFTAADSGTENCPITYEAEGTVVINGGIRLKASDFGPLNEAEKKRLCPEAREKVVKADLKKYGLTRADWGEICAIGVHNVASKFKDAVTDTLHCELFVNDTRMIMARYPNEDYLYTEDVIQETPEHSEEWETLPVPKSDIRRIDAITNERVKCWKSLENVWIFGYPKFGWADVTSPLVGIDTTERTMESKYASKYGLREHAPYYFFNIFEELDAPGEWYLDREEGMLYLYPPTELEHAVIDISITTAPLLQTEGVTDITFRGFTFTGTRGDGIRLNGDRMLLDRCEVKNVARWGVLVSGNDCCVSNSNIHHTGFGGVNVSGGNRDTLTSSGNWVFNNHIHHIAEINRSNQPGISIRGVNGIVSHNCVHDLAHIAITFSGNEHVIEYNEIYNVCQMADDSSAIYSGRNYTTCGNVIRYNYFHDICSRYVNQGIGIFAIYCDDNLGATSIYGNLMYRCQSAVLLHGGHDIVFKNNLIIDACENSAYAIRLHAYLYWKDLTTENGDHAKRMREVDWKNDIWQKKYPHVAEYLTWDPETEQSKPHYCEVSDNVIINHKPIEVKYYNFFEKKLKNIFKNNIELADRSFAGIPQGEKLDLTKNRLAEIVPGFEQIPFEKMGRI